VTANATQWLTQYWQVIPSPTKSLRRLTQFRTGRSTREREIVVETVQTTTLRTIH
jgi:hypothetical protein